MRAVDLSTMVPNPAPMIVSAEAAIGTTFTAFTGDTTYTVEGFYRRGVIVSVRCREFGWQVTNGSARFSYDHAQKCLAEGRWNTASASIGCPYCGHPVARTVNYRDARDRELCGEHCGDCHLPFEVAADGSAIGQDDSRYSL